MNHRHLFYQKKNHLPRVTGGGWMRLFFDAISFEKLSEASVLLGERSYQLILILLMIQVPFTVNETLIIVDT